VRRFVLAFAVTALAAVPSTAFANGDDDFGGFFSTHDTIFGFGKLPLSPGGFTNYFAFGAFSLPDGSHPGGYLIVTAPETGMRFTGFVRCLNVQGNKASLVMTFDSHIANQPPQFRGAVFWVEDNGPTLKGHLPTDVQRNFRLTQAELDTTYATCPGVIPPTPGRTILSNDIVVHDVL
jgi:hypothetical protein